MVHYDLTTLRLFVAVCETGSLRRAGEQANLVGSALSKRLAQLEDALGTPVLARRRHGMAPTQAGETLLEHARALLERLERIDRDMAGYARGTHGLVHMLCSASMLQESLAQDVADFLGMDAHRDIQVDLEEQASRAVVQGVSQGTASLGLCWDAIDLKGLASRPYRQDHLVVAMHPSHPLSRQRSLTFAQTLDYQQVGLTATTALHSLLRRIAAHEGKPLVHRVVVSSFNATLRAVRANLAIGIVPLEIAQIDSGATGLCLVPLTDDWATRQFVVCFRDEGSLLPASQLLLAHLTRPQTAPGPR